jgi:hypothetical protein
MLYTEKGRVSLAGLPFLEPGSRELEEQLRSLLRQVPDACCTPLPAAVAPGADPLDAELALLQRWFETNENMLLEVFDGQLWRGFPANPPDWLDMRYGP